MGFSLAVSMTGQWIRTARGFNQNIRPNQPGLDVHRSHFVHADADFIDAEPRTLAPNHGFVVDLNPCGEQKIAFRPAAGLESLGCHSDWLCDRLFFKGKQVNLCSCENQIALDIKFWQVILWH